MVTEEPILPVGFECAQCLYDLSAAPYRICPECGRSATDRDVEAYHARLAAAKKIPGLLGIQAIAALIICGGMTAGAVVLTSDLATLLQAAVGTGCALIGSVLTGVAASRFARRDQRAAYLVVWLRTHLWLHAAWLTAPLSGLLVVVALGEKVVGHQHSWGWLAALAIMGPLFWLLVVIACAVRWRTQFRLKCEEMQLGGAAARWAFACAAAFILLGALLLGLGAGDLCFELANKITPVPGLPF